MNSSTENAPECTSCELTDDLNLLRGIDFFARIPLDGLKILAYLCTRETYKPGDILFSQGDDDGQAFYLITGKAKLSYKNENGQQVVRDVEKGDFLGRLVLLGSMPRLFTLTAETETTCLVLERAKFLRTFEQFPGLTDKVFQAIIESIVGWDRRFLSSFKEGCNTCCDMVGISLI
jgi:CRP/FNR family transcriptional regulator, cyclic AMP receptor protein